jgi:hypothetical protein
VNNLDEPRLVTWVVHTARRFVERAKREARHRRLAVIRHTQRFNIFTKHTKNGIAAREAGCLTTIFDGVADGLCKTANTRRPSRRAATTHLPRHFAEHLACARRWQRDKAREGVGAVVLWGREGGRGLKLGGIGLSPWVELGWGQCCHGRGVWVSSMAVQISGAAGVYFRR